MDKAIPEALRLRTAPWHDAFDAVQASISVLACHGDALTESRQAELAKQAQFWADELERRALAVLQLAQVQLAHTLSDVLSHSVRTPLTVVVATVTTLAQRGSRLSHAWQRDLAARMNRQLYRLDSVLGALSEISIVNEQMTVSAELVSIDSLIERAAALGGLGSRVLHVSADNLRSWVDPGVVIRALRRVFDNIAVHTPENTCAWVSAWQRDGRLVIRVEDDGPGMPTPQAQSLLGVPGRDRFEDPSPRLGLGLALASAYAQLHGGNVSCEPSPRGGVAVKVAFAERHESG